MILGTIGLISFIILIFITTVHVNRRSYHHGKDINHVNIPDIIHNNFTPHKMYKVMADTFTLLAILFCFMFIIVKRRWDMLIFFVMVFVFLYIIHLFIVSMTTLPDCSKKCTHSKTFLESIKNMGTCNNLGASGHLMNLGLSLFIISWLQNHVFWYVYVIVYVISFFVICASRNHYTLDCVVSTLILALVINNAKQIMRTLKTFFEYK